MGLFSRLGANSGRRAELESALTPRDRLLLEVVDADSEQAIEAARRGDPAALAAALELTRRQRDWDRRTRLMEVVSRRCEDDSSWLDDWLAGSPDNADATCLKAWVLIGQAWAVRSGKRAKYVSDEQFEEFFRLLEKATTAIQRAQELDPDDPEPWAAALCHARGLQAPREVFDVYLREFAEIDPHHFGCHAQALQFVCDKWYGSREEMYEYAVGAASAAPADAQVQTLPLVAMVEHVAEGVATLDLRQEFIGHWLDRAKAWVASAQPRGGYLTASANNVLAYVQDFVGASDGAYESLVAMGPYVTDFPWYYWGEGMQSHLAARTDIVKRRAKTP